MTNFPQLPRYILRQEDQPGYDKEIWQPTWQCFCCQDTGIVRPDLVKLVISDYNWSDDALPICQKEGCSVGSKLGTAVLEMADYRLGKDICNELDKFRREDWKKTIQIKFETIQQLAQSKSLRTRPRTPEEEEIARFRHQLSLVQ